MPPFRTYLVLSVVFFLVAFFDPKTQLRILYEPGTAPLTSSAEPDARTAAEIRQEVRDELAAEGILIGEPGADATATDKAADDSAGTPEQPDPPASKTDNGLNIQCGIEDFDDATMPPWLAKRLTPQRMAEACERITADNGRAFGRQLLDNVPAALFVLLPLMAFVLKMLYPLSKRYYVEHLLFVLHYHAFFFLIMTVEILFSRLAALLNVPATVENVAMFGVSLYVPVYLYKSMRRVYEQGRAITLLKFLFLVLSYLCGLVVMLIFVALYTAVSI
jgi:hypothetical protein